MSRPENMYAADLSIKFPVYIKVYFILRCTDSSKYRWYYHKFGVVTRNTSQYLCNIVRLAGFTPKHKPIYITVINWTPVTAIGIDTGFMTLMVFPLLKQTR